MKQIKTVDANLTLGLADRMAEKTLDTPWETAAYKAVKKIEEWVEKGWGVNIAPDGMYIPSESKKNIVYFVPTGEGTCECEAFAHGRRCWHRAAARMIRRLAAANAIQVLATQRKVA